MKEPEKTSDQIEKQRLATMQSSSEDIDEYIVPLNNHNLKIKKFQVEKDLICLQVK